MGSYLIFISPLIARHNYNLGLKKGSGINWINLAAISCACMLILAAPPLERNLIKHTNNKFKADRNASWERKMKHEAGWNQNNVLLHASVPTTASLKGGFTHGCFFTDHTLSPWLLTYAAYEAAEPTPLCFLPTCRLGRRWLKQWQVDSTLKPSIDPWELNQTANPPSLSARLSVAPRGRTCGGWEGRLRPVKQLRRNPCLSGVTSSRLCGLIQKTLQLLTGGEWRGGVPQHFISTALNDCCLQMLICTELWPKALWSYAVYTVSFSKQR